MIQKGKLNYTHIHTHTYTLTQQKYCGINKKRIKAREKG